MLANIKADLNSRIMGCRHNVEVESSHALNIDDSEGYATELKEELDAKLAGHQLVWSLATKKLDEERDLVRVAADKMIQMSREIRQCSQPPENAEDGELTEGDTEVEGKRELNVRSRIRCEVGSLLSQVNWFVCVWLCVPMFVPYVFQCFCRVFRCFCHMCVCLSMHLPCVCVWAFLYVCFLCFFIFFLKSFVSCVRICIDHFMRWVCNF